MSIVDNISINQQFDPEGENGGYKCDRDAGKKSVHGGYTYFHTFKVAWGWPEPEPEPKPEDGAIEAVVNPGPAPKTFKDVLDDARKKRQSRQQSSIENPCGEIVLYDVEGKKATFPKMEREDTPLNLDFSDAERRIIEWYSKGDVGVEVKLNEAWDKIEMSDLEPEDIEPLDPKLTYQLEITRVDGKTFNYSGLKPVGHRWSEKKSRQAGKIQSLAYQYGVLMGEQSVKMEREEPTAETLRMTRAGTKMLADRFWGAEGDV